MEIRRGEGIRSRKRREFVVSSTFPGFSAGSWKVHVRTWLVRTGKLNIPHSVHLSGYRPVLSHAALNKQYFQKNVHLYRPLIWKSAIAHWVHAMHFVVDAEGIKARGGGRWPGGSAAQVGSFQQGRLSLWPCVFRVACPTCIRSFPFTTPGDSFLKRLHLYQDTSFVSLYNFLPLIESFSMLEDTVFI